MTTWNLLGEYETLPSNNRINNLVDFYLVQSD